MFTDSDDVPLGEVLAKLRDKEEGKVASLNWRKASAKELQNYFAEVLPDFDRDRVHTAILRSSFSGMKFSLRLGITNFEEDMKTNRGRNIDDRL